MEKEFNNYPSLEKKYGETAFEIAQRDMKFVDRIIQNNRNMEREYGKRKRI